MHAVELISDEIPPLRPSDPAIKAVGWMDEFKVSHLPIVDKNRFVGMVAEIDLLDLESAEQPLSESDLPLNATCIAGDRHVFEVVKLMADNQLSVVAVVENEMGQYLGSVSLVHLMEVISNMSVVSDPGGIIILELNQNDYMLSQIARCVEDNDAKILGTFITSHQDSTKMVVTLKLNRTDIDPIIQTLERFDYNIIGSYGQLHREQDLQDRWSSLMNYLNI